MIKNRGIRHRNASDSPILLSYKLKAFSITVSLGGFVKTLTIGTTIKGAIIAIDAVIDEFAGPNTKKSTTLKISPVNIPA